MFKNILNGMTKIYREDGYSDDPLFKVQDICGPVYLWPQYIKKNLNLVLQRAVKIDHISIREWI